MKKTTYHCDGCGKELKNGMPSKNDPTGEISEIWHVSKNILAGIVSDKDFCVGCHHVVKERACSYEKSLLQFIEELGGTPSMDIEKLGRAAKELNDGAVSVLRCSCSPARSKPYLVSFNIGNDNFNTRTMCGVCNLPISEDPK